MFLRTGLRADNVELAEFGAFLDVLGDADAGAESGADHFRVGAALDERVGSSDDAGTDFEHFELEVRGDDGFEAEAAPEAAEAVVGFFDDAFAHLEDLW